MKILLGLIYFIILQQTLIANIDNFTYKGYLTNKDGVPVTLPVSSTAAPIVSISLFNSITGGVSGYIQTFLNIKFIQGDFSLDIGPSLPDLSIYKYMELTIDDTILTPREFLYISPQAVFAQHTNNFAGMNKSQFKSYVLSGVNSTNLGTIATQNSNAINFTGGNINGVVIGNQITNDATFSNLVVQGTITGNGSDLTNLTKAQVSLENVTNDSQLKIASNFSDLNNATTARSNLGLGSVATQNINAINFTGGLLNNISLGLTTPSSANFTSFTGVIKTSIQTAITKVGNLESLIVSGNLTASSITILSGIFSAQNGSFQQVNIQGGSITNITDLTLTDGGTGASNALGARTNLGLGSVATQNSNAVSFTGGSITNITDLTLADGGTGASNASGARTNLGLGSVATQNSNSISLSGGSINGVVIGGTTKSNGNFINLVVDGILTANGSNLTNLTKTQVSLENVTNDSQLKIASNFSDLNNVTTARSNLGLGSVATQNINAINFTGGSLNNISIGLTTATSAIFTNISGVIKTPIQTNITSLGELSSLKVSGNVTATKLYGDGYNISNLSANAIANNSISASKLLSHSITALQLPTSTLNLNAGVKLGSDPICNADSKGVMAFNNDLGQICTGSFWINVEFYFAPPSDFTELTKNGRSLGYIQNSQKVINNVSYNNAVNDCWDTYGGRLPSPNEFQIAINEAIAGILFLTNDNEWTSNGYYSSADGGYYALNNNGAAAAGTSYRCFIQR